MVKDVFKYIDNRKEEYKQFLKEFVSIESLTADKEGVDKAGKYIVDFAKDHGFKTKVKEFPKAGNGAVITMNEEAKLPTVAFLGHIDTVHEKGKFGYPVVRESEDKLFGPGITDMKGGIAIALLAMQGLRDAGYKERPIKLILIGDEEVSESLSGQDGVDFICDESRGSVAAINCEGSEDLDYVTVGRKGSVRFKVDVTGKASHAGQFYADGISAIKEAAHKILAIEAKSDPENITYNCGIINGGTVPNMVPEKCSFVLYNRYVTMEQREELFNHIETIVNKSFIPGTKSEKVIIAQRPPMEITDKNMMLFEYIRKISLQYGFGDKKWKLEKGGSDSSYTSMIGVPSVCSMGILGGRIHSKEEFAITETLCSQAKLLTAIVHEMPEDFGK